MKKIIKIAHLYYDLMNLYGEDGNILALERFIERQKVDIEIHKLTLGDNIDFRKYDLYYIGGGTENNEHLVLGDLLHYKIAIKEAIENGKMFLATGNAMELFGRKIRLRTGRSYDCLNIFGYNAIELENRIVTDIIYEFPELDDGSSSKYIFGFKNCSTNIVNNDGEKIFSFPDNIRYKNFYGIMINGPLLVRNPYFTNYILEKLFQSKGYEFVVYENTIEFKAYQECVNNFVLNSNLD